MSTSWAVVVERLHAEADRAYTTAERLSARDCWTEAYRLTVAAAVLLDIADEVFDAAAAITEGVPA